MPNAAADEVRLLLRGSRGVATLQRDAVYQVLYNVDPVINLMMLLRQLLSSLSIAALVPAILILTSILRKVSPLTLKLFISRCTLFMQISVGIDHDFAFVSVSFIRA